MTIHLTQIFLHTNLEESPNSLRGDLDEHPRVFQMDDLLSHLDKLFNYQIHYVIKSTCGWSFESQWIRGIFLWFRGKLHPKLIYQTYHLLASGSSSS